MSKQLNASCNFHEMVCWFVSWTKDVVEVDIEG